VQFQTGDVSKVCYFFAIPDEFKIKSLYSNDLILNIASKIKETVQKLQFLDSPSFSSKNSYTYGFSGVLAGTKLPPHEKGGAQAIRFAHKPFTSSFFTQFS